MALFGSTGHNPINPKGRREFPCKIRKQKGVCQEPLGRVHNMTDSKTKVGSERCVKEDYQALWRILIAAVIARADVQC